MLLATLHTWLMARHNKLWWRSCQASAVDQLTALCALRGVVDSKGVANMAAAAKEAGLQRVVLVSSIMVTPRHKWCVMNYVTSVTLTCYFYNMPQSLMHGLAYTYLSAVGTSCVSCYVCINLLLFSAFKSDHRDVHA